MAPFGMDRPVTAGLIRSLDNELSSYFERFFALGCERLPFRRIVPCLRFLQALPFRNAKALGRLTHQRYDLSRGDDPRNTPAALTAAWACGV
jgi:hypothetical protein